jgi:hypothetical protein
MHDEPTASESESNLAEGNVEAPSPAHGEDTPRMRFNRDSQQSVHIATIITGFAVGVLKADMYFKGYRLPPNFSQVVDYVAERAQAMPWKTQMDGVVQVCMGELEKFYETCLAQSPEAMAWSDGGDNRPHACGSQYGSPDRRDSIDPGTVVSHAIHYVVDDLRLGQVGHDSFHEP